MVSDSQEIGWNYDKNGTDWDLSICNTTQFKQQSPMVMNISMKIPLLYDWRDDEFSFVPSFYKSNIKSVSTDTLVQTYELEKSPDGKFIGFWAGEPKHGLHKFVRWDTTSI